MSQAQTLSAASVQRSNRAAYRKTKRIDFETAHLDVDLVFRPSGKRSAIAEFLQAMHEMLEAERRIDPSMGLLIAAALLIKTFTTLTTNAQGYRDLLELACALEDGGYLGTILNAFEPAELEKFYAELNEAIRMAGENLNEVMDDGGR